MELHLKIENLRKEQAIQLYFFGIEAKSKQRSNIEVRLDYAIWKK